MMRQGASRLCYARPLRFILIKWKMGIRRSIFFQRKWLLRLAISFMLGFSNAINQDSKSIDDTSFKIEETIKK
ncbi:hypothetical protein SAMN04487996_11572 [Dyadobacter soli]|uniref:Uncharacterized protein n=1 Tax=Dyadobacter soli TaxID=659014 RepID=A0A1G7RJM9_9BACT|nr:hypothetical protein SAMN04487996_11572 [Dyadobacter soli]